MTLCNIDPVEQVLVGLIVKVCPKRLIVESFGTRPEGLVGANWRPMRLSFDHSLGLFLGRRCEVDVSIQVILLELDRLALHGLDFLEVFLVV